jgi:hypothetical protein
MRPKWMEKRTSVRSKSDKKVARFAKKTGGKVVANSGATHFSKGDISYKDCLVEHKYTDKKSYKLDKSVLCKIYQEALMAGK